MNTGYYEAQGVEEQLTLPQFNPGSHAEEGKAPTSSVDTRFNILELPIWEATT